MSRTIPVRVLSLSMKPGTLPWVLLPLACLMGGLSGHLLAGVDTQGIAGLLEDYTASILTEAPQSDPMGLMLWMVRYLLVALVLGCSTLGVGGLPLLLAFHGFTTGYAISAFYRTWGYAGLRTAALWVAVVNGILLALLLAVSIPGWTRSWELVTGRHSEKRPPGRETWDQLSFCLMGMAIAILYEHFISQFAALVF
ncbi:MAG: hypothetical protein IJX71_05595 [Oscillospiraceae bacterium]|nr:hypothetical protein [Oscillospiraceae bacterium]